MHMNLILLFEPALYSSTLVIKAEILTITLRAETSARFVWIFTWLHMYLNTKRVFGCTVNDFSALIIAYLTSLMVFQ